MKNTGHRRTESILNEIVNLYRALENGQITQVEFDTYIKQKCREALCFLASRGLEIRPNPPPE